LPQDAETTTVKAPGQSLNRGNAHRTYETPELGARRFLGHVLDDQDRQLVGIVAAVRTSRRAGWLPLREFAMNRRMRYGAFVETAPHIRTHSFHPALEGFWSFEG
jgi:hypothetical protein